MKIINMHPARTGSKLKAFFDVEFQFGTETITVKGFKIAESKQGGHFVGMPSEKGSEGKYFDRVILSQGLKVRLNQEAVQVYESKNGVYPIGNPPSSFPSAPLDDGLDEPTPF